MKNESQACLQSIAQNVPGLLFKWYRRKDRSYGFYYFNERFEEICGFSPKFAHRYVDFIHPQDRDSLEHAPEINSISEWQGRLLVASDQVVRWIHSICRVVKKTKKEKVYEGIAFDITQKKFAEKTLQEQLLKETQLRELNRKALAILKHKSKGPLSSLLISTSILENSKITPDDKSKTLQLMKGSVGHLADLIHHASTFQELEKYL
jgi:hypothetical protein